VKVVFCDSRVTFERKMTKFLLPCEHWSPLSNKSPCASLQSPLTNHLGRRLPRSATLCCECDSDSAARLWERFGPRREGGQHRNFCQSARWFGNDGMVISSPDQGQASVCVNISSGGSWTSAQEGLCYGQAPRDPRTRCGGAREDGYCNWYSFVFLPSCWRD